MSKLDVLREYFDRDKGVAVAFSSGVDSTLLLKVAHDLLGDKCVAITAVSSAFPEAEIKEAKGFCDAEGIRQICFDAGVEDSEVFRKNPKDRCYHCKHLIFGRMVEIAKAEGFEIVVEGTNADDVNDYRPGLKAIEELGLVSPLKDVGLSKAEIRELSKELGLPTFSKPAFACLATRFPVGEAITRDALTMVDRAEEVLKGAGFLQYRVRCHRVGDGYMARIEVLPEDISRLLDDELREDVCAKVRECGFRFVSLDLEGYRMGKMN
ncbi:MAG: ATP-dependent sacrificial sulfur transferase LarE [Lachnospiraceae bacterium]|nr:ATP-dependent sacrificial sulfur transferase LarE [Lachnospiraceae bacterium]